MPYGEAYSFQEYIRKGLNPYDTDIVNTPALEILQGGRVLHGGIRSLYSMTEPANFGTPTQNDWRYTKYICSRSESILIYNGLNPYVLVVEEDTNPINPYLQTVYDYHNPASAKSWLPLDHWHVADFHKYWIATNGKNAVMKYFDGGVDKIVVEDLMPINSVCNHRNRLILGGMEWPDSAAETMLDTWTTQAPAGFDPSHSVDLNTVLWGGIGDGSARYWYDFAEALSGPYDYHGTTGDKKPLIMELWEKNQMGFAPMPWRGEVLSVASLRDNAIVCGDNGVALLIPISNPYPTFAVQKISNVGIAGRGAIGGSEDGYLVLGADGRLYAIDSSKPTMQVLGYKQQMVGMLDQNPRIDYNPIEREFYIHVDTNQWVYKDGVLAESEKRYNYFAVINGGLLGNSESKGDDDFTLQTMAADLGSRQTKRITGVDVQCEDPANFTVNILYRSSADGSFKTSSDISLDHNGHGTCDVSCVEFKVKITNTDNSSLFLDDFAILYDKGKTNIGSALS